MFRSHKLPFNFGHGLVISRVFSFDTKVGGESFVIQTNLAVGDDENNNCHDNEGLEESSRNVRLILRSIDKTVHQVLRLSDLIQDSVASSTRQTLASGIIESVMTHLAMPPAVMPVMFPGISNAVSTTQ